jgi:ABC-2 type transport system permease protein/lipopolysaccharide transport system permease protein
MLLLSTWFGFVVRYRKTIMGPLWTVIGPALFILVLGGLYSQINDAEPGRFVPHLTVGIVVWTFINSIVSGGPSVFTDKRGVILQGGMTLSEISVVSILSELLLLLHQLILIVFVMIYFSIPLTPYSLVAIVGFAILMLNAGWVIMLFGILGARYRDIREIATAVMRIAFLATPIIWMPEQRGGFTKIFLDYNPFYHMIEIVRAPLLGNSIGGLTWFAVIAVTVAGYGACFFMYRRYAPYVVLWV